MNYFPNRRNHDDVSMAPKDQNVGAFLQKYHPINVLPSKIEERVSLARLKEYTEEQTTGARNSGTHSPTSLKISKDGLTLPRRIQSLQPRMAQGNRIQFNEKQDEREKLLELVGNRYVILP